MTHRNDVIRYGFEGDSVSAGNTAEQGSDFDLLQQKLRAIHRFVSWALEEYADDASVPVGVSEAELLGLVTQAVACSKALVALSGMSSSSASASGGGSGGSVATDGNPASISDEKMAMLKQQIGRSESAARSRARNMGGGGSGGEAQEEVVCELLMMSGDIYDFAALLDEANAVASRTEAIKALRIAAALCPEDADVQSSLGEQLFETGKLEQSDSSKAAASFTEAAAVYEKALALAAPDVDAVSSYNLLCIALLLHNGGGGGGGGDAGSGDAGDAGVEKLNVLLEAAAAAAAADGGDGDGDDDGGSKEDSIATLKQELRDDEDLEAIVTSPFSWHSSAAFNLIKKQYN